MGISEVMDFVLEKLKEVLAAMENLGAEALAWFDNVFPQDTRGEKIRHWVHVALPFLIAAVVLTVVVCLCRRIRGAARIMKAPGRNCRMQRNVFECNPKGYFRNLREMRFVDLCGGLFITSPLYPA